MFFLPMVDFELAIERHVRVADQRRPDHVRFGRLDAAQHGREIRHVEREELDRKILPAFLAKEFLQPFAGDLSIVVVGREDVALLGALLLDHVVDERLDLLAGTMPVLTCRRSQTPPS